MLDATVGSLIANSYVTEEEADLYFEDRLHSSWESVTDKSSALITASRMLDWMLTFKGVKTADLQSMQFPRVGIILSNGYEVSDSIIPQEVKYATFELAQSFISADRTADSAMAGIEQVKAGPLFIKATPAGIDSTKSKVIPEHIRSLLAEFISNGSIGVVRLMRA